MRKSGFLFGRHLGEGSRVLFRNENRIKPEPFVAALPERDVSMDAAVEEVHAIALINKSDDGFEPSRPPRARDVFKKFQDAGTAQRIQHIMTVHAGKTLQRVNKKSCVFQKVRRPNTADELLGFVPRNLFNRISLQFLDGCLVSDNRPSKGRQNALCFLELAGIRGDEADRGHAMAI